MKKQRGFTYVGLLILVAVIGMALAGTAALVSTDLRRDREQELLFIGTEYARAIASYRASSPGNEAYPTSLEALLEDKRTPVTRRHLRKLYRDPMTQSPKWGLVMGPNNGITAVYSLSEDVPLKQAGFPKQYEAFTGAQSYGMWRFAGTAQNGGEAGGGDGEGVNVNANTSTPSMGVPREN